MLLFTCFFSFLVRRLLTVPTSRLKNVTTRGWWPATGCWHIPYAVEPCERLTVSKWAEKNCWSQLVENPRKRNDILAAAFHVVDSFSKCPTDVLPIATCLKSADDLMLPTPLKIVRPLSVPTENSATEPKVRHLGKCSMFLRAQYKLEIIISQPIICVKLWNNLVD